MIRNGPSPSVLNEGLHIEKGMCACMCSKSLQSILWTVPRQCFCLWDSPGNSTRVGCHALLQGIFPTQGSNLSPAPSALAGGFFTAEPRGKPLKLHHLVLKHELQQSLCARLKNWL